MTEQMLRGRRILLVEDEYLQAMDTKRWLEEAGAEVVGPTGYADEVPALLRGSAIDAAVVDINLGKGANYSIAAMLQRNGVPFLFLTGYDDGSVPGEMAEVPRLSKPADERKVVEVVRRLIAA